MGYDVWVESEACILPDKIEDAARALWGAARESGILGEDTPVYTTAEDLTDAINENLSEYIFMVELRDDGTLFIDSNSDAVRHEEDDQWILEAMGPYVTGHINFKGEDGNQWRWEFSEKGLKEVYGEVVFGDDIKAPEILGKIIKVIYPENLDGKPITSIDTPDYEWVVGMVENIIREGGFGPQAGMTELERLAEI
jgi:hypothetical protein